MADFGANVLSSSVALLGLLVIMGLIYTIWSQINMKKKQKYFKDCLLYTSDAADE